MPFLAPVFAAGAAAIGIGAGTPLILSGVGAGFTAGAFAFGTAAASLGGSLLLSAALGAAQMAIQRASYKDKGGGSTTVGGINNPEVRLNTRQGIPPQRRIYGRILVGGALFFEECKPPYYYQGFLLSNGPITGIEGVFNTQVPITVDLTKSSALVAMSAPYQNNWRGSFRRGDENQAADPLLAADFPELGSEFRQRGIATMVSRAHYGADWDAFQAMWGSAQRPNIILLGLGVPVYDPRDPTQRLPTDPNDPDDYADARSSWKWSNTAALVQADYLWWADGGRVPLDKMDWAKVAESANWDEGLIGTKSGELITRHTIDGVVTAGQEPLSVMQSMLTANRGFVCRSQGKVWVQSSQPVNPELTITDDMLVGGLEFRRAQPKRDLLNRVRCRFIDSRQEWQSVDGPILDAPGLRADDGDLYEASIEFTYTADHRRAQRLQRAHLLKSRLGRAITATVDIEALGLEAGHVVRVSSQLLPKMNGLYRVQEVGFADGFSAIDLTLTEYDPSIENDWNPETDEQDFVLPDLDVS